MDSDIFLPFVSSSNELQFGEIALGSVNVISEIDTYIFNGTTGDVIQLIVTRTSGSIQPEFEVQQWGYIKVIAHREGFTGKVRGCWQKQVIESTF